MGVTTTKTNKPLNPRGNDQSPLAYNRAKLYSGKALDFDGVNDNVDISTFSMSGQDGSFCFYYQQDANSAFRYIFDMIPTTGVRVAIVIDDGQLKFLINNEALANQGEILNGEPNFCVITSEGTTQNFYINGQFIGSQTSATYISLATTGDAAIGSRRDGAAAFLDGQIAGFKIFNTALTAAQVADLYNNPEKVVPTGVNNTALKLWLPMMEGAGTTAYDGSGNGNHGTISGATYVHGVGAPVSQSAVMDWNKGTNLMIYSEQFDNAAWQTTSATVTANDTTAPDGSETADKIEFTASGAEIIDQFVNVASSLHIGSVFLKNEDIGSVQVEIIGGAPGILGNTTINLTDGSLSASVGDYTPVATEAGNGWYRVSVGDTGDATIATPALKIKRVGSNGSFYAWGAQVEAADSLGAYIPNHTATPITTPVLLPQGLTTGRDITGVNLFENVRKQGALNLDGNSWAEVHDNESLDFGTGSFTLEAWVKAKYVNQGSGVNAALSLGGDGAAYSAMFVRSNNVFSFYYNSFFVDSSAQTEGDWVHIVGTYDETNQTLYIDGSQVAQNARSAADISNALVKHIGRDSTTNRTYQDSIAQPRIYNRALTAEEVQRNYNAGKNTYTNS